MHSLKIAVLLVSIAILTTCSKEEPQVYTILQGQLAIGTEKARLNAGETWENIALAEDGTFADTLTIESPQYVSLSLGDFATMVYLTPGSPAPDFDYENYAGGNTKLADLKGKYVYIDLWATWCGPCICEIPYLKEVEKEFHDADIEFVSISVDDPESRDAWRDMIKNKELGGTQLLADNGWDSDMVRNYGMKGIPHFILLDEEGNIVSAKAERPSNPKLKERLQALGK